MIYIITGVLIIVLIIEGYFISKYKKKTNEIVLYNEMQEKANELLESKKIFLQTQNQEIENDIKIKKVECDSLSNSIQEKMKHIQDLVNHLQELKQKAYEDSQANKLKVEKEYEDYIKDAENAYQQLFSDLFQESQKIELDIDEQMNVLNTLKEKYAAYIEAKKREEEKAAAIEFYKLNLSKTDLEDIELLRSIQNKFSNKDAIDKIIWESYVKSAYDKLIINLFKLSKEKVCGIYKITNLKNDKAYIGQSLHIQERFRQHIKKGLSYAPSTNKLYQEMQNAGIENFSFEVLDKCPQSQLNERELYWIDFYKTKEYGLNTVKGVSK